MGGERCEVLGKSPNRPLPANFRGIPLRRIRAFTRVVAIEMKHPSAIAKKIAHIREIVHHLAS